MQNTVNIEQIISVISQLMNKMKGTSTLNDVYLSTIYVLYGYHKQYPIIESDDNSFRFEEDDDQLLSDLYKQCHSLGRGKQQLGWLYHELSKIPHERYEDIYPDLFARLNDLISANIERSSGEFFTPAAISALMAYFVNKEKCTSVFDPFCGTGLITHQFSSKEKQIHFEGQDFNYQTTLLARVNIEALYGKDYGINYSDSITEWNKNHFDAVVTCPPLGIRLTQEQTDTLKDESTTPYKTLEDILFTRPFKINKVRVLAALEPISFCFRGGQDRELRKSLIEQNVIDTVIALPSNILYGTSIACAMIICKTDRSLDQPIKLIHAENYFIGENKLKRTFDIDRFLAMFESEESSECIKVTISNIRTNDYNLNPSLYYNKDFVLQEGQQTVHLSDLITAEQGEHTVTNQQEDVIPKNSLSKSFIEVLLNKNKLTPASQAKKGVANRIYHCENKEKYILIADVVGEKRYGLHTDNTNFVGASGIHVFRIKDDVVTPEYLVHLLVNTPYLNEGGMPLANYMMRQIVIDNIETQEKVVRKLLSKYDEKERAEREADAQRLGIKRNISDLEHMLGTPQFKINRIISRLERATPSTSNYPKMVKQLKDNMDYMIRIIHFSNAQITKESINLKEGNLIEYINNYVDSWKHYGGEYFKLQIVNELENMVTIPFDKTLLTVMFDSILTNAIYHGFHKRKDYTANNTVEITLSMVEYQEKAFVCVKIANNGEVIDDGFTIEDYISRGRYSSVTGRSGLGGYHVNEIVKGHNGFLSLDNNKLWNVILEILLPTNNTTKNLIQYEHKCI